MREISERKCVSLYSRELQITASTYWPIKGKVEPKYSALYAFCDWRNTNFAHCRREYKIKVNVIIIIIISVFMVTIII